MLPAAPGGKGIMTCCKLHEEEDKTCLFESALGPFPSRGNNSEEGATLSLTDGTGGPGWTLHTCSELRMAKFERGVSVLARRAICAIVHLGQLTERFSSSEAEAFFTLPEKKFLSLCTLHVQREQTGGRGHCQNREEKKGQNSKLAKNNLVRMRKKQMP